MQTQLVGNLGITQTLYQTRSFKNLNLVHGLPSLLLKGTPWRLVVLSMLSSRQELHRLRPSRPPNNSALAVSLPFSSRTRSSALFRNAGFFDDHMRFVLADIRLLIINVFADHLGELITGD